MTYYTGAQITKIDMEFLYNQAESKIGICSSMNSFINTLMRNGVRVRQQEDHTDQIIDAISKVKSIEKALKPLDQFTDKVLYYSFADIRWPHYFEQYFSFLTGSAYCATNLPLTKLELMAQANFKSNAHSQFFKALSLQAQQLYDQAIVSYDHSERHFFGNSRRLMPEKGQ